MINVQPTSSNINQQYGSFGCVHVNGNRNSTGILLHGISWRPIFRQTHIITVYHDDIVVFTVYHDDIVV